MNNLDKINEDISGLNHYIDILVNEDPLVLEILKNEGLVNDLNEINEQLNLKPELGVPYNVIKLVGDYLNKKDVEGVILDKDGNPIASVDKDDVEEPDEEEIYEPDEEEDVFGQSDTDKDLIRQAQDAITTTDALLALSLPAGAVAVTKSGEVVSDKGGSINSVKIYFKGNNNLSVVIGDGDKIEHGFFGFRDFDIQTIKKTGKGYIMNLTSPKMPKNSSLLLYVKTLNSKPQTNLGQLSYNNGKFIGNPKQISFEVVKLK